MNRSDIENYDEFFKNIFEDLFGHSTKMVENSKMVETTKRARSYNEYLQLWKKNIVENKRNEMSANQIEQFIKINYRDYVWNIKSDKVKSDMFAIIKYLELLEKAVVENGRNELSTYQIEQFIKENHINYGWDTVKWDMLSIVRRFEREKPKLMEKERIEVLKAKYRGMKSNTYQKSNKEIIKIHDIEKKKNDLSKEDKKTVMILRDMLKKYPDIVEDNRRLKAGIADIIPEKKKEVNLLGALVDRNIMQAIRNEDVFEQILFDRFALVLEEEYGTSLETSRRMVEIWVHVLI